MSWFPLFLKSVADSFRGNQRKATVTLLSATLLAITWKSFGTPQFFAESIMPRLGWQGNPYPMAGYYCFLSAFFLLGVVPALIVKYVFGESLADYGVRLGIRRRTLLAIALGAPVFAVGGWIGSFDPIIHAYNPINRGAGLSPTIFVSHAITYLGFYLGWEFLFRGFLQHGLRETVGDANAVIIQAMASCIAHLGRPTRELFFSLPASLYWGMIAFRTQSLLAGLVQHFMLGIVVDWFICFGYPR